MSRPSQYIARRHHDSSITTKQLSPAWADLHQALAVAPEARPPTDKADLPDVAYKAERDVSCVLGPCDDALLATWEPLSMFGLSLEQWTAIGVIATGLGVIVTAIGVMHSGRQTRKGLAQEERLAENAAKRSEAAARLTEDYTRRVVDALEKIASQGFVSVASPARVRWELVHHGGDRYRLTNVGDLPALSVEVETHETLPLHNVQGGPDLGPREAITFMALTTMGTADSTVTVRWHEDEKDEGQVWRYPLPARLPRS